MSKYEIFTGDVYELCKALAAGGALFDAFFCDPPYGFSFMGRDWDHKVPGPEVWRVIGSCLRPGASGFAFGGTRKEHRLTCAIEDGGFEIRDKLAWFYGQGFPKNHDIVKVGGGPEHFAGYGTALKPAYEPIVWAMLPRDGSFANNATEHGVAGINIDAGRIETDETTERVSNAETNGDGWGMGKTANVNGGHPGGRWPPNVILDEAAGVLLDMQAPDSGSHGGGASVSVRDTGIYGRLEAGGPIAPRDHWGRGGASRFYYCPKASKAEREAGLAEFRSSIVNDGRKTSIDNAYQRGDTKRKNTHPTVKPVDLCRYLAAMLLPPPRTDGKPRRLLVPFSGSGSEMIGALLAGWDEIVGIELDPHYVEIAQARLKHWKRYRVAKSDRVEAESAGQFDLIDLFEPT